MERMIAVLMVAAVAVIGSVAFVVDFSGSNDPTGNYFRRTPYSAPLRTPSARYVPSTSFTVCAEQAPCRVKAPVCSGNLEPVLINGKASSCVDPKRAYSVPYCSHTSLRDRNARCNIADRRCICP